MDPGEIMNGKLCVLGLFTAGALFGFSPQGKTVEVMRSGGFAAAYRILTPEFTEKTGITVNTVSGGSMGSAPTSIPNRLDRGELADVVILASEGLEMLIAKGQVIPSSRLDLANSLIGMVVRSGAAVPDISTVAAFERTLFEAKSVAYSGSASGAYLSTQLFPSLRIADRLKDTGYPRERWRRGHGRPWRGPDRISAGE
jgi:molybdate transport system substrate-binding protein